MEYLDYLDLLGPLLTTSVAIIALYGNPYKENTNWWKRLNWRGVSILILIIISVGISLLNTKENNRKNKNLLELEAARYDSLRNRNNSIEAKLVKYRNSNDSLTNVTKDLKNKLIEVSMLEIKEQQRIFNENKNRVLKNILNETVQNLNTLNSWKSIRKEKWINEGVPTVRFSNQNLKSALLIPINDNLSPGISLLIKTIDEIDEGLKYVEVSEPKSKDREENYNNILFKLGYLEKNLNVMYNELKKILPKYEIIYKTSDSTFMKW